MSGRLIDPRQDIERAGYRAEGWRSQRDLEERDEQLGRYPDSAQRLIITNETLLWYRANVGASGDAAYLMRGGIPTSDSAWAMTDQPQPAPGQGRIVLVRLTASEDVTAGTIQARIRVIEGADTTDYTFEECELSTTYVRTRSAIFDWSIAYQFAKDATIQARAVTVGMTPTTLDLRLAVTLGYETWV